MKTGIEHGQTQAAGGDRAAGVRPGGALLRFLAVGCGLAVFFLAVRPLQAWERDDVLSAIHQVENPRDVLRLGPCGELGPFQFRLAVWSSYTQKPFMLAMDAAESQLVAEAHYDWITRGLQRNGMEVTPYSIGLAWNAGLMATVNHFASEESKRYAQRVANLVEDAEAARSASAKPQPSESPKPPEGVPCESPAQSKKEA